MDRPQTIQRVHFIGIGGAGMSGVAKVLHERGVTVTGSDLKRSHYVRILEAEGIKVFIGHKAQAIDSTNPDVVVISSAIPDTNPELVRAYERRISVWHRAQMLSWLSRSHTTIAVAGTHGKTTTSSMVASMLETMGLDPSFLIGGIVEEFGTNGKNGNGNYFVCEADESDGSFLYINPTIAVITNIEADHMDHYHTMENLDEAFLHFMRLLPPDGALVISADESHLMELARTSGVNMVSYGLNPQADYVCVPDKKTHGLVQGASVRIAHSKKQVHFVISHNPGIHNLCNATAALAVADNLGLDVNVAAEALSKFEGARRRFSYVGEMAGITVVDDYGHHPTEIKATLQAASTLDFKRIICVFQPHRYTRTEALAREFGSAFDCADVLRVTDIFAAGEMPIPGITGKTVVRAVKTYGHVKNSAFAPDRNLLLEELLDMVCPGDLVITQGAGDITMFGPDLLARIKNAFADS